MGYSESIKSIGLSEAIKLHFFGCAVGSLVDHRMNRMIYTSLPCVSLPGQPQGGQEGLARPSAGGGRAGQWRCVKERPLQCSPEVRKSGSPEVQTCQTQRICEGRAAHDEKARPLTTSGPPDFRTSGLSWLPTLLLTQRHWGLGVGVVGIEQWPRSGVLLPSANPPSAHL